MKGDFTRFTFRPGRHYDSVLMQQGRVQTDADWNEQVMIAAYRNRLQVLDIIGPTGAPQDLSIAGKPPFVVYYDGQSAEKLFINTGRYYVDGHLVENEETVAYVDQPGTSLPPAKGPGAYLLYLDVWRRHITFLEDPDIREVALAGADSGTRGQLVWQARMEWVGSTSLDIYTLDPAVYGPAWQPQGTESTGSMNVKAGSTPLENQLYRVEVHRGGNASTASFKWSRDNGTVVARVSAYSQPSLATVIRNGKSTKVWQFSVTLDQSVRDSFSSFLPGHMVELSNEEFVFQRKAGIFGSVTSVVGATLHLELPESAPFNETEPTKNPLAQGRDDPHRPPLGQPVEPRPPRRDAGERGPELHPARSSHPARARPHGTIREQQYGPVPDRRLLAHSRAHRFGPGGLGRGHAPIPGRRAALLRAARAGEAPGERHGGEPDDRSARPARRLPHAPQPLEAARAASFTGSGTANVLPRWQPSNPSMLQDSGVIDDGLKVKLDGRNLEVSGSTLLTGTLKVGTAVDSQPITRLTNAALDPTGSQVVPTSQAVAKYITDRGFGSGAANTLVKWTGTNTLDKARITDDGSSPLKITTDAEITGTLKVGTGGSLAITQFSNGALDPNATQVIPTSQAVAKYVISKGPVTGLVEKSGFTLANVPGVSKIGEARATAYITHGLGPVPVAITIGLEDFGENPGAPNYERKVDRYYAFRETGIDGTSFQVVAEVTKPYDGTFKLFTNTGTMEFFDRIRWWAFKASNT